MSQALLPPTPPTAALLLLKCFSQHHLLAPVGGSGARGGFPSLSPGSRRVCAIGGGQGPSFRSGIGRAGRPKGVTKEGHVLSRRERVCGTWAPGHCGVATCWTGPMSQSGLGGAALLLARGNFLACAGSSVPTEKRDGKGRRRQKGNPVREQMPLSGVWEDLFFQLSLPLPAPPPPPRPDVGQGPSQGLGGWHS